MAILLSRRAASTKSHWLKLESKRISHNKHERHKSGGPLLCLLCFLWLIPFQNTARPGGVISGRVVDDQGRPMRGARVQALARTYEDGSLQMTPRGNPATTNDRGEFRLFWLE